RHTFETRLPGRNRLDGVAFVTKHAAQRAANARLVVYDQNGWFHRILTGALPRTPARSLAGTLHPAPLSRRRAVRAGPTGALPRTPARSLAGTPAPRSALSQARCARRSNRGSVPDPGSVARAAPCTPLRPLAGALCAPA